MPRKLKRYYVTMTWEPWPEGGSYGTILMARDYAHAETLCRREMAKAREEEVSGDISAREYLRDYSQEWEVVDCFELDTFMVNHITPETIAKWAEFVAAGRETLCDLPRLTPRGNPTR